MLKIRTGNPDYKFGFNLDLKISIRILDHNQIKSVIINLDLKFDVGALNFGLKYSN